MKTTTRLPALAIAICVALSVSAFASGEASGGPGGGSGGSSGGPGGGGGGGSAPTSYDAVLDVTEDTEITGVAMESVNADENIIHVYEGASAAVTGSSFVNGGEGGRGGDAASFYGVGATLFVSDGELYVDDVTIDSTVAGGAGVFAYADGVACVQNADIHTSQGSAGGLHVAGGGTLYAWDCQVETEAGMAAAAIRSDRGGGTMVIDGGSYVTNGGTGAVYVTADISVHDAYLYTGGSEAIAIEGKNTVRLFDCELEGSMIPGAINDNKVWNIIVYQSMSGDAENGTSHYEMVGGRLTTHAGPIVYNTNTASYITFSGVDITRSDDTTYLLQVTGNSSSRTWGRAGANGANCIFTAVDQLLPGDVVYDTISNLDFYLLEGSELTGAVRLDDTLNGGYSGDGMANVYIDADSAWVVTGDSYINGALYCAGTIENAAVQDLDGAVLYGGGEYVVTVGAFETDVDVSGAGEVPVWEDYAVENPFEDGASGEASDEASASEETAAADAAVPATDGTENQTNTLGGSEQPATAEEYEAYEAYLREFMTNYDGVGDGTFDEGARSMALGELDSVGFGADVSAFPFEMYVSQFGALSFAEWSAQ